MTEIVPKIDIFTHILPEKYRKKLSGKLIETAYLSKRESRQRLENSDLFDMQARLLVIESHQGLKQVLTLNIPPIEDATRPEDAVDLARLANDEMAELVDKYPDHFAAAVAGLPLNDMDAALKEAERAIETLHMRGVQLYTPCMGRPLDDPVFFPLYELMTHYDLPVWLHPTRSQNVPDYPGEDQSKHLLYQKIGWPYETTAAMARMVLAGVMEKFPALKIITHHCGAMVPYFAERLAGFSPKKSAEGLLPMDYFKMFYGDTALSGGERGLKCGYDFFGAEHILFGTDMPYGDSGRLARMIAFIQKWDIPDSDRQLIFEGNARRLMRL